MDLNRIENLNFYKREAFELINNASPYYFEEYNCRLSEIRSLRDGEQDDLIVSSLGIVLLYEYYYVLTRSNIEEATNYLNLLLSKTNIIVEKDFRLEIYFKKFPSPRLRNEMKENKFRWDPDSKCWYAIITNNARKFAHNIIN